MMTPVTVYHNVQRECRACGGPVIDLGDDEWAHLRDDADHIPVSVTASGFLGYQPGHALVPVFQTEVPDGRDAEGVAQRMYDAFNADPEFLGPEDRALAADYRARRLRSLSVGDVVDIGGALLAVASCGFLPVAGEIRRAWLSCHGTVPLPHCSRCLVIADQADLMWCDPAGHRACRDAAACSARMHASP
jgi:hypothetical protein